MKTLLQAGACTLTSLLLITGCNTVPMGQVTATAKPEANLLINPGNLTVASGQPLELAAGQYTLLTELDNHHIGSQPFTLFENQQLILSAKPGTGYGQVAIHTVPANAQISLSGKELETGKWSGSLDSGNYQVKVTAEGYLPQIRNIKVETGKPVTLNVSLKPVPIKADITVTTTAGAQLYFRGRKIATGHSILKQQPPGTYQFRAVKDINSHYRKTGQDSVTITKSGKVSLAVPVTIDEKKYAGNWLPWGRAVKLEQQKYQDQVAVNPVSYRVVLNTDQDLRTWRKTSDLKEQLHNLLRVGDRVEFVNAQDSQSWTVWKRDSKPSDDFVYAVSAFIASQPIPKTLYKWKSNKQLEQNNGTIEQLAYNLNRARSKFMMADLSGDQISEAGLQIIRNQADGELTLLITGEKPDSKQVWIAIGANSWIARVPASSEAVQLGWNKKPEQLLVVSDTAIPLPDLESVTLEQQEKQEVSFTSDFPVAKVDRLTTGPDNKHQWESFDKKGYLATMFDLSRDEIGPHNKPGEYQRTWLLTLENTGLTQRQLSLAYKVIDKTRVAESKGFLRRSELDNNSQ